MKMLGCVKIQSYKGNHFSNLYLYHSSTSLLLLSKFEYPKSHINLRLKYVKKLRNFPCKPISVIHHLCQLQNIYTWLTKISKIWLILLLLAISFIVGSILAFVFVFLQYIGSSTENMACQKSEQFNRLLQGFSKRVDQELSDRGAENTPFSEEMILNPTFPKKVLAPFEQYLGISPAV